MRKNPFSALGGGTQTLIIAVFCFATPVIMCGCKKTQSEGQNRTRSLTAQFPTGPVNLIEHIGTADRLTVCLRSKHFSLEVKDKQLDEVLYAIASMQSTSNTSNIVASIDSPRDCEMRFFKGTNLLANATFGGSIITYNGEYDDETGVLDSLYKEVIDQCFQPRDEKKVIIIKH